MKIFNDERASSVMFATLMLILIVITVGSAFAFTLSLNQKQYMERQSALTSQQNENLKIISIKPYPNEMNKSYWAGFDFTIFNGDINEAQITAISLNDHFMLERFLVDDYGKYVTDANGNPNIFNGSERIDVPAGQKITLHVGALPISGNMSINSSGFYYDPNSPENILQDMDSSGWVNLNNDIYSFTVVNGNLTFNPTLSNLSLGTNYPTEYMVFVNNEDPAILKKDPVKVELLTSRVNVFSKVFSPPNPVVNIQTMSTSDPTISNLILDASGSNAPNGFITDYMWEFTNGTPLGGWDYANTTPPIHGIKNNKQINNTLKCSIDLIVTDNYGMSSDLGQRAGNITIPYS
jgi:hypothetical protein